MIDIDARLDRMIEVAEELNISLDYVVSVMGRCSQSDFDALSDKPSRLPMYMKSKVKP